VNIIIAIKIFENIHQMLIYIERKILLLETLFPFLFKITLVFKVTLVDGTPEAYPALQVPPTPLPPFVRQIPHPDPDSKSCRL